ncbi:MAG TPA: ChaN family lipoprotein [Gemmatimonadales bacterium]
MRLIPLAMFAWASSVSAQGAALAPQGSSLNPDPRPLTPGYTPHRVYDTRKKSFIDFETLAGRLSGADIVFVGEQHDDPATHRMELALLEGVARRRDSVVLGLEMFERDAQPLLDGYLGGSGTEADLLRDGRPWKNYQSDYRPLVELARSRGWPVVASNVPRPLASLIGRAGLAALDTLPPERRSEWAQAISCPEDEYFDKFKAVMGDMAGHGASPAGPDSARARLARVYEAQCVKDETMGESVARAWRPGRLVVHYNGAFHSDYRLGTAERARQRAEGARVVVITAMPVADLDRLKPSKDDRKRADYLLYVLAPAKADSAAR